MPRNFAFEHFAVHTAEMLLARPEPRGVVYLEELPDADCVWPAVRTEPASQSEMNLFFEAN